MESGNVATWSVNGTDMSAYSTSASLSQSRDQKEIALLGSNPTVIRVGPNKVTFSAEGPLDPVAHAVLQAAYAAEPPVPVTIAYVAQSGISGSGSFIISTYDWETPGDDIGTYSLEAGLYTGTFA